MTDNDPNTAEAAFPLCIPHHPGGSVSQPGMTLRDYFAAQMFHTAWLDREGDKSPQRPEEIAERAYEFADAMLKARRA
jgi:hypothetical protein